ncbi:histidine phosphatase superfamily [Russula compacta]|nr:histidine phosphatase superfamily [Russula compacta]
MAKKIVSDVADDTDYSSQSQFFVFDQEARRGKRAYWCTTATTTAVALVFASLLWLSWTWIIPRTTPNLLSDTVAAVPDVPGSNVPDVGFPESELRNWGQYSPYIPVAPYVPPPPGCTINQVNLLQRHGARWPTTKAGKEFEATVKKLKRAKHYKKKYLHFLKHFKWDFEEDSLLPLGAKQSFEAGTVALERYRQIVTGDNVPFVRAAGQQRVVDSAGNWTAGFRTASGNQIKAKVDLVLSETGNITLDDTMCPNAGGGNGESERWLKEFAPSIKKRLNEAAPGAHLTNKDAHNLMSICIFHTQVKMAPSPFCGLFAAEEFKGYEYHADLGKFYSNGYGGYLGPVQGVGYVNELLARLTGQPVQDHTQSNHTLDSSPETFPLDRTLYADFSHDNEMVAIYSALGLFRQYLLPGQKLDPTCPSPQRTWVASRLVPFSARMVVEKLECNRTPLLPKASFVRVLVNDALQPLEFCGGIAGLCELHAFVASQWYARDDGGGDFEKCFD